MYSKEAVKTNVLVLTKDELIEELEGFYAPILDGCASDIISGGKENIPVPDLIWERGLRNLSLDELAIVSDIWIDVLFDTQSDEDVDSIGVVILQENGTVGSNIVLGTTIDAREKQSEASEAIQGDD